MPGLWSHQVPTHGRAGPQAAQDREVYTMEGWWPWTQASWRAHFSKNIKLHTQSGSATQGGNQVGGRGGHLSTGGRHHADRVLAHHPCQAVPRAAARCPDGWGGRHGAPQSAPPWHHDPLALVPNCGLSTRPLPVTKTALPWPRPPYTTTMSAPWLPCHSTKPVAAQLLAQPTQALEEERSRWPCSSPWLHWSERHGGQALHRE